MSYTLNDAEKKALNEAVAITEAQVMRAIGIVESKFKLTANSQGFDAAVASVTQALATNYATVAVAYRGNSEV